MLLKQVMIEEIHKLVHEHLSVEDVSGLIEKPKVEKHGDFAFPCFALAKLLRKSPQDIAKQIANQISHSSFSHVQAVGPYVNVFINRKHGSQAVLTDILKQGPDYGKQSIGEGKKIVLDFSSPNIAKPFSMGHLRSTVIGQSLALIVEKIGYTSVKINHLGDWGTQFGKLIHAYKIWGDEGTVRENPIEELLKLYVKFHEEAESHPELEDEGRAWFKKLEDGDGEAIQLWKWFREESLKEFQKIYHLLGVEFDSFNGEAFYNDKMDDTIKLLKNQSLLTESDGAEVVSLDDYDLPPSLIKKRDGATLYTTRDLTAAIYRQQHYQFEQAIYVVGHEQSLHFKQLFLVLKKMGYSWADHMHHVPFGFILKDGKKMSTRKGKVVLLDEVIKEAIELAKQNIEDKNPNLGNKEEVAQQVGVGAVIFHDLKNDRLNNVEFSLEDMLRFEGNTGPYVQYTHARAQSILSKTSASPKINFGLEDDESWQVVKLLHQFSEAVLKSYNTYEPSVIAKYLIDLSQAFNKYYGKVKILSEDEYLEDRLALVNSTGVVIKEGLRLLGISAPENM
ncbi:arginine--tRNA ligase [Piscibacillus sp. B03]|uniref:arginine--tRNA ligase n=1 Tax=Piscibacillus sp. B03 TaxID=3457430 RepID=UPI003FCEA595